MALHNAQICTQQKHLKSRQQTYLNAFAAEFDEIFRGSKFCNCAQGKVALMLDIIESEDKVEVRLGSATIQMDDESKNARFAYKGSKKNWMWMVSDKGQNLVANR